MRNGIGFYSSADIGDYPGFGMNSKPKTRRVVRTKKVPQKTIIKYRTRKTPSQKTIIKYRTRKTPSQKTDFGFLEPKVSAKQQYLKEKRTLDKSLEEDRYKRKLRQIKKAKSEYHSAKRKEFVGKVKSGAERLRSFFG